ncbi:MAG: hypothetical protein ACI9OJ_000737, partial [Myxococcota bacterium]
MTWQPLRPLAEDERTMDAGDVRTLIRSWRSTEARIASVSPEGLAELRQQLIRAHAIAAGLADRLFDIHAKTAELLALTGFREESIPRSNTDTAPEVLVDILRDHVAALKLGHEACADGSRLTETLVHRTHAILTRHQLTTPGIDEKGRRRRIPLQKGVYRVALVPDGEPTEMCPVDRIPSEMDRLLSELTGYDDVDPMVVAAWVLHGIQNTQPYQDGNGRVALTVMNLVLMRRGLLPVSIGHRHQTTLRAGLGDARGGNYRPLTRLISSLQKSALLQALSVQDATEPEETGDGATSAVIASLQARVQRRRSDLDDSLRQVNQVALALRTTAREFLEDAFSRLAATLESLGQTRVHMRDGGPDRGNAHWYRADVLDSVGDGRKWVNFDEDHYFLKASIRFANDRLVFVVSMHHVGRELSGIMEITAFAHIEAFEGLDD